MAARRAMIERIVIETETPGDSRTMFRVRMDDLVLGENLTAAQAHLIGGEVLDRITLHGRRKSLQSDPDRPAVRGDFAALRLAAGSGTNRSGSAFLALYYRAAERR
jgi:hypothetical protein